MATASVARLKRRAILSVVRTAQQQVNRLPARDRAAVRVSCSDLKAASQHRVRLSETNPEIRIATTMVTRTRAAGAQSRQKQHRNEYATSEMVMETMVKPISRAAVTGRAYAFAQLHVAHDVLEHHDGVVHHEPTESVSPSAKDIQTITSRYITANCPRWKRAPPRLESACRDVAQKQENHQNHDAHGQQQGELHVAIELRIDCDASYTTARRIAGGSSRWNCGSSRRMLSTTSTVFVPGCRLIPSITQRTLFIQRSACCSPRCRYVASCSSRTGVPFRHATMMGR